MASSTWSEIKNSDAFLKETNEDKQAIMNDYFQNVIKPQAIASGDNPDDVYNDFSSKALVYSADEVSNQRKPNESYLDTAGRVVDEANNQLNEGLTRSGRAIGTAALNTVNIVPEIADAFNSAGAWAGGKLGLGDGTYQPAPRLTHEHVASALNSMLPASLHVNADDLRARGTAENLMAEAIPFLFGTGEAKLAAKSPEYISSLASRATPLMDEAADAARMADIQSATGRTFGRYLPHPLTRDNIAVQDTMMGLGRDSAAQAERAAASANELMARAGFSANREALTSAAPVRGTMGKKLASLTDSLPQHAKASTVGSLAANSEAGDDGFASDLALNALGGRALEGLGKAGMGAAQKTVDYLGGRTGRSIALGRLSDDVRYANDPDIAMYADPSSTASTHSYDPYTGLYGNSLTPEAESAARLMTGANDFGGRMGTQTLRELSPEADTLLNRYNIGDTASEKLLKRFDSFRDPNLRSNRVDAVNELAGRTQNQLGGLRAGEEAGSDPARFYDTLNSSIESLKAGDHKSFNDKMGAFEDWLSEAKNSADINDMLGGTPGFAEGIVRDVKQLGSISSKAKTTSEKAAADQATKLVSNMVSKLLIPGLTGFASGGIGGAALGFIGQKAIGKVGGKLLTRNAGRGLEDVSSALRGEYTTPASRNLNLPEGLTTTQPYDRGIMQYLRDNDTGSEPTPESDNVTSNISQVEASPIAEPMRDIKTVAKTQTKFPKQVTDLYRAISGAETGNASNRFIRTKAAESGVSTAYGPAQITTTLMEDFYNRHSDKLTDAEKRYARDFIKQGNMMKKADDNDPIYGYGGTGVLTSQGAKAAYSRVSRKMLQQMLKDNKGDVDKTVRRWRGNDNDSAYFQRVGNNLNMLSQ